MWQFLCGYVIIQIDGLALGRFLQTLTQSGIRVRQSRRTGDRQICIRLAARDFARLHRFHRDFRVRIRILEKHGLPFLKNRLRRRYFLLIGLPLMLLLLYLASQRIWFIRYEGLESIEQETIETLLAEHGLSVGRRPEGAVLITAANDLSARIERAAWVELHREGVFLIVTVQESKLQSPWVDSAIPADVVADKSGVITAVQLKRGQALVAVGQRVQVGDVLLSGTVVFKDNAPYTTHADGVVKAAISYEAQETVVDAVTDEEKGAQSVPYRRASFDGVTLFASRIPFERYVVEIAHTTSCSDVFVPLQVETGTVTELVRVTRSLSADEADELALMKAETTALQSVPKDAAILNVYRTIRTYGSERVAVCVITAEETIGITKEYPYE